MTNINLSYLYINYLKISNNLEGNQIKYINFLTGIASVSVVHATAKRL